MYVHIATKPAMHEYVQWAAFLQLILVYQLTIVKQTVITAIIYECHQHSQFKEDNAVPSFLRGLSLYICAQILLRPQENCDVQATPLQTIKC